MATYPMAVSSHASAREALQSSTREPYGNATGTLRAGAHREQKGSPREVGLQQPPISAGIPLFRTPIAQRDADRTRSSNGVAFPIISLSVNSYGTL